MSKYYLHMLAFILTAIGALNAVSYGALGFDALYYLNVVTFNSRQFLLLVYVLMALSVIHLIGKRDSYLPFLGESVIPMSLPEYTPKDGKLHTIINVDDPEAVKVMYWSANPSSIVFNNHDRAYQNFNNAGIVPVVDKQAKLILTNCPAQYKVPQYGLSEQTLPKHIHFRYIRASGMASEVFTREVDC